MKLKIILSLICIILAGAHILFPAIKVDYVTVVFLILAALPWCAALIKSLELPGGFKIELQDVKAAIDKVAVKTKELEVPETETSTAVNLSEKESAVDRLRDLAYSDPTLALVSLRIEIEKRLVELAQSEGISTERRSAGRLLQELKQRNRLSPITASGLYDLIALGNKAAHGMGVTRDAAEWAIDASPTILAMIAPPHVAFLRLWDALDKAIISWTGVPFNSLWRQTDLGSALDSLEEKELISTSERDELVTLHTLRWDITIGCDSWFEDSVTKIKRLEQLFEKLKRRWEVKK